MKIETRSIDYIPLAERHGKVRDVWPVWFSGGAQLGTVATGMVSVELGLDLAWSMVALLVGSALGTPQFYLLWGILFINVTAGIGILEKA